MSTTSEPVQLIPNWEGIIALTSIHLLSLLVLWPWLFDWRSVVVMALAVPVTGMGINLSYHRQLTHRSFSTPRWVEYAFVCLALCCYQDTPAPWIANHRRHHIYSDRDADPHSPVKSFLWGHFGWLFVIDRNVHPFEILRKYARDILDDPFYMRLERGNLREIIFFAHAGVFMLIGAVWGYLASGQWSEAWRLSLSFLVWSVFLRTVITLHITWSVNSVCHRWGYRNFATNDDSKNNLIIGFLASGEGWHNNHHADPVAVTTRRRWWEFDLCYLVIWVMSKVGLAYDLKMPRKSVD